MTISISTNFNFNLLMDHFASSSMNPSPVEPPKRKAKAKPDQWKDNRRKCKQIAGVAYISWSGKYTIWDRLELLVTVIWGAFLSSLTMTEANPSPSQHWILMTLSEGICRHLQFQIFHPKRVGAGCHAGSVTKCTTQLFAWLISSIRCSQEICW